MPPLPATAYFEMRLKELVSVNPRVAELAEQIASVQKTELIKTPSER